MNGRTAARYLFSATALAVMVASCQTPRVTTLATAPKAVAGGHPVAKLVWSGQYAQHIQPIFDQHCVSCHNSQRAENGLSLASYREVMKGTQFGPVVIPGSPSMSALVSVVEGKADLSIRMPRGATKLSDPELKNLALWIEAGALPD